MPDNSSPFDFDDDNMNWLNADLDPVDDAGSSPPPSPAESRAPTGDTTTPPWQAFQAQAAPPPQPARGSAPWQSFQGQDAPPPAAPSARPPWGESAPDTGMDDAGEGGLTWLSEDALDRELDALDARGSGEGLGAFDWDTADRAPTAPGALDNELPSGMTGALPWRQETRADDDDDDVLGLDDDLFEVDVPDDDELDLDDDLFAIDTPAGDMLDMDDDLFDLDAEPDEAVSPAEPAPSLRDRLLAASPSASSAGSAADLNGLFDDEPDEPDDELDDDDMPDDELDDLEALFDDEFAALETDAQDSAQDSALADDDDWLDEAFEQVNSELDPESDADEPDADEPDADESEISDLGMQFVFDDDDDEEEEEALPDWLEGDIEFPEEEPEPAPRGIRRIAPAEPPEDDYDDYDDVSETSRQMEDWLTEAEWDAPTGDDELGDLTYEEWERLNQEREQEAQRTEEDRLLETVPEMFLPPDEQPPDAAPKTPPPGAGQTGSDFVPGWFLGLDDTPQEDVPDWFQQAELTADLLAAPPSEPAATPAADDDDAGPGDVPDWFQAPELPDTGEDWATAFGAPPPAEEPIIEPPSEDDADLVWMTAPDATPEESDSLPLPKTGALFGLETPIPQPDIDSPPPDAGDTWLDEERLEATQNELDESVLPQTGQLFGDRLSQDDWDAIDALDDDRAPAPDLEAELPLPATGDLRWDAISDTSDTGDEAPEPEFEASEVPDWLAEAAPGEARVDPADIPFPDLDLDQTMPGETALDDLRAAALDAEDGSDAEPSAEADDEADDWIAEFAPTGSEADFFTPDHETGQLDDFVERFDPNAAEAASEADDEPAEPVYAAEADDEPAEAAATDDAPSWLRELGEEGSLLEVPDDVDLFGEALADASLDGESFDDEDEMDWLSVITEDTVAEPVDDELISVDRSLTPLSDDRLPTLVDAEPEEPEEPAEPVEDLASGVLHTAPLDSSALDALLGLDDAVLEDTSGVAPDRAPALPPDSDLAVRAERESALAGLPDESLDDLESLFEGAETGSAEQLAALFAERESGDEAPDLTALFDESGQPETAPETASETGAEATSSEPTALGIFPDEAPAAQESDAVEESKPRRRRRFGRRRKQEESAPEPTPEDEFVDVVVESVDEADDRPMWIDEMRPSDVPMVVKAGGAETSVRQKQVIELPDRLRAFYERTQREIAPPDPLPAADEGPLAGIAGALPTTDLMQPGAATRPVEGLVITPEQQKRIDRLQALLDLAAAEEEELEEERAELTAVDTFILSDFHDEDEEGEPGAKAEPEPDKARARRPRRFKVDRVITMLVILAALVVPFFTDVFHFASDPPPLEDDQLVVADAVDLLATPDAYVLFAFEYGPTAAGELDPLAQAVIRDALTQGAIPLTISTDPAGALHAAAVIAPLVDDEALLSARDARETTLTEGEDYVLLRYLTGEAVGVRSLATVRTDADGFVQQHPAFSTNLRGDDTNLAIGDIAQDIALIVVIGEDSGAVRTWAEQLHPVAVPKLALVTTAIEPLTIPYVMEDENDKGYVGYLAGIRDTYSYNAARNTANRSPYVVPDDAPIDVPDPAAAQWHSTALGALAAALLVTFGMLVNLFRGLRRRRR